MNIKIRTISVNEKLPPNFYTVPVILENGDVGNGFIDVVDEWIISLSDADDTAYKKCSEKVIYWLDIETNDE